MRGKCRVQRSSHCPPNTLPVFAPNVSFGIRFVYDISQTILFRKWLRHVRDPMSRARLVRRIERLAAGNAGRFIVRLLKDALRSEALATELAGEIALKSDGNPFFVFEILRGLREGQFLAQRPDGTTSFCE